MRRMLPVGMEVCYIKGDVESEWRRDRAGWFGLPFWKFSTSHRENSASPECLLYLSKNWRGGSVNHIRNLGLLEEVKLLLKSRMPKIPSALRSSKHCLHGEVFGDNSYSLISVYSSFKLFLFYSHANNTGDKW
jgi:hypothetical protein